VLAGRCVADLFRTAVVILVVLGAGLIIGFRFDAPSGSAIAALGLALAAGFSFIWLYALIGLVARDPETAQLAGVLTMMPLLFGSSVFVRVQNLPGWLQTFARNQPVTVTVDAVRALSEGGATLHVVLGSVVWIFGLGGACAFFSVAIYRRS
jgi:ABC transporter DrrB family efflux protein